MLSKEALIERRKGLGGSDAAKIVSGDWFSLWQDKTGRVEPEDLSGVFAVQMGNATETLNLDWYERKTGQKVVRRGETLISAAYPFLRVTLDGASTWEGAPCVVEAKHCNGYSKIDELRARYTPQVMHEMIVCGVTRGILSVIIGTNEPALEVIDLDDFWATDYIEKCREFWQYVIDDHAPEQGAPMIVTAWVPGEKLREVDMSKDNTWVSNAKDWLENKAANKKFDDAAKALRAKITPDIGRAAGGGVVITRSKDNKLMLNPEPTENK